MGLLNSDNKTNFSDPAEVTPVTTEVGRDSGGLFDSPSGFESTPEAKPFGAESEFASESQFNVPSSPPTIKTTEGSDSAAADFSTAQQFASELKGAASDLLNNYLSDLRASATSEYNQKASKWANSRKDWFNPSYDTIPSLEEYLAGIPKGVDALSGSTLSGGMISEETGGGTLGVLTLGLSAAFDDQEQAEYIWNKGGEGAAGGALSGGWVGALVGGAIGVVTSALDWAAAEEGDEANIKKATEEYQRKYDTWLEKKKKRMAQAATVQAEQLLQKKQRTQKSKRGSMMQAMNTFGGGVIR